MLGTDEQLASNKKAIKNIETSVKDMSQSEEKANTEVGKKEAEDAIEFAKKKIYISLVALQKDFFLDARKLLFGGEYKDIASVVMNRLSEKYPDLIGGSDDTINPLTVWIAREYPNLKNLKVRA